MRSTGPLPSPCFELLQDKRFRLHSNDIVFVRYSGRTAIADFIERKLYIPTNSVESFSRLASLFDASKCENVITRKEDCQDAGCLREEDCRLDRGSPFCYKASKEAHAMLDPNWIGGLAMHTKRTTLRWVFLLRNDTFSPAMEPVSTEDALRLLEAGEAIGAKKSISPAKSQPFYNPHFLLNTPERIDLQKAFFRRLLESTACYLFNSGVAGAEKIKETIGAG